MILLHNHTLPTPTPTPAPAPAPFILVSIHTCLSWILSGRHSRGGVGNAAIGEACFDMAKISWLYWYIDQSGTTFALGSSKRVIKKQRMALLGLWIRGGFRGCNAATAAVLALRISLPLMGMSLSTHKRLCLIIPGVISRYVAYSIKLHSKSLIGVSFVEKVISKCK